MYWCDSLGNVTLAFTNNNYEHNKLEKLIAHEENKQGKLQHLYCTILHILDQSVYLDNNL